MAYEIPGFMLTLAAGSDFTSKQFRFGTLAADGDVDLSANGEWVVGVVQNTPSLGRAANVMCNGVSMVEAGAAITTGDAIAADTDGVAITAAIADVIVGRALESAAGAGEIIAVLLGGQPAAQA